MAFLTRISLRPLQVLSSFPSKTALNLSHFSPFRRSFSTSTGKIVCKCKVPETDQIIETFRERNLRQLTQHVSCHNLKKFEIHPPKDCALFNIIAQIATPLLNEFRDVAHIGDSPQVLLWSLNEIPKGDLGDLSGDHGKQLAKFLKDCKEKNLISDIGSVFDVGGQNTSTVQLISELTNNQNLPCVIVDLNPLTPAISKPQNNVKYVIEDGRIFFTSQDYDKHTRDVVNKKPSLFIFNNMLNVLKAEDGWVLLKATWERLQIGDYLVISGLVPEQLEKPDFTKYPAMDGIVEFHHNSKSKKFYKSALSPDFFEFVSVKLTGASVLSKKEFNFSIEKPNGKTMDVQGRRLLISREKIK